MILSPANDNHSIWPLALRLVRYGYLPRLLIISFLLCISSTIYSQDFTRKQAIHKAITEFIVPPTLEHTVTAFITKMPLQPGDVIAPFVDGEEKRISKPTWFVWINDNSDAWFAHETRYLFIDAETGEHELRVEEWWPTLNEESLFISEEEMTDLDLIIYSDRNLSLPDR